MNLTQSKLAKSLHLKICAKIIKKLNTNKLNYKIMKEKSKVLKSTVVTNNVSNGCTSFILLVEHEIEYFKTRYIVTNQINDATQIYTFQFESYEDAMKEFKKQIILATVL